MRLLVPMVLVLLSSTREVRTDNIQDTIDQALDQDDNLFANTVKNSICTTSDGKEGRCTIPEYCARDTNDHDAWMIDRRCVYPNRCCALDVKVIPEKNRTSPDECGWSTAVFRGDSSNYEEFPWLVAIFRTSLRLAVNTGDYVGAGTLIHPTVVLTVAHRVDNKEPSELMCRAGPWRTESRGYLFANEDKYVRKIVIHDDFNHLHALYDAALLFLQSPFDSHAPFPINVACLAREMPAPGTLCYTIGWNTANDPSFSFKKAQIHLIDPEVCQRQLRMTQIGSRYVLHDSLTCIKGDPGEDVPCFSAGGAPLMCPVQVNSNSATRYAVYGVGAFWVTCHQNVPLVYAKIPIMIDWIDREMSLDNLNRTTYSA